MPFCLFQKFFSAVLGTKYLVGALQSNAKFAVAIDKDNAKLQERKRLIDEQRSKVGSSRI